MLLHPMRVLLFYVGALSELLWTYILLLFHQGRAAGARNDAEGGEENHAEDDEEGSRQASPDGRQYYYNTVTNITKWEKPKFKREVVEALRKKKATAV
mmetsp:Transcript_1324/g.2759  ORF Transcript_1324/g.2759 Transcript_1324/m.2759 type:complete len:98 (+) Transcript_1324:246-539(+)